MKCMSILLVTLSILQIEAFILMPKSVEDHFWREYTGLVPSDAIPGGLTETGDTTYIGQFTLPALYEKSSELLTIPAFITKGSTEAVGTSNGLIKNSRHDSNTKVLCSAFATTRYKWYSPTALIPPRCHFIVGGLEDAIPLYIARTKVDRATLIGKVYSDGRHDSNIVVPGPHGREIYVATYEVLTYCY